MRKHDDGFLSFPGSFAFSIHPRRSMAGSWKYRESGTDPPAPIRSST